MVYGRRRIGKTRLLLEWAARHDGLYTVADQSSAAIQRRYFAEAVSRRLPGFADVEYRDWATCLSRLAREARAAGWRGPVIFDELPYLVVPSPELPSALQRFLDHDAREARLVVAVAGSSQRMMQGLVLASDSPLFGRAREILELRPMAPPHLKSALGLKSHISIIEAFTAWGGVPRYWELAAGVKGKVRTAVDELVLDPLGPLHREPDRLLIEELPSAVALRPLLDAIGAGAHRISEIAGRVGRPATSLSRPMERLLGMGLVEREVPFGEPERKGKRSLYRVRDPFFRLWFRVVAPYRGLLAGVGRGQRRRLLDRHWDGLVAATWEEMCRGAVSRLDDDPSARTGGPHGEVRRWWRGNAPEWDIVAESLAGDRLLLGEVKWSAKPFSSRDLKRLEREIASRPPPDLPQRFRGREIRRALFLPALERGCRKTSRSVVILTAGDVLQSA